MKIRAHYIAPLPWFELNAACETINTSFATGSCYLVGSAMTRLDYRDVDVRCILSDEEYDRLFSPHPGAALWSLMCVATSAWLRDRTGLEVDFQIQRATQANRAHHGPRCALGVRLEYPGEVPRFKCNSCGTTYEGEAASDPNAAHYAERDALDTLSELESPRSLWRPSGEHIDDITHACAMTARARVEQVRALVALLTWGLS